MGDHELNAEIREGGGLVRACRGVRVGGWAVAVAICAAISLDVGLRLGASAWWRVVAEAPAAAWSTIADVVGLALLPGALALLVRRRAAWPTAGLLLVTAGIMHVVGRVLVFGFRDLGLGVAWALVHAIVMLAIVVVAVRGRYGAAAVWRLGAMTIAAAAFVVELGGAIL